MRLQTLPQSKKDCPADQTLFASFSGKSNGEIVGRENKDQENYSSASSQESDVIVVTGHRNEA